MKTIIIAKSSIVIALILSSCQMEHPKDQKRKRDNAEAAYVSRHEHDSYPIEKSPKPRPRPSYPWEK
jgi:hypothetical protein